MDCGVPFCHQGCPLGNLIPDWNDLVYRDSWRAAIDRLHLTNNFPEFTGLLCPAPCEGSCVLGINNDPVTIKSIELAIVDRAFDEGWIVPEPPPTRTWKKVAVIGSGPAGLAAAAQLNRAGHSVTVFEKSDRIGGLLRYGIPEFKLENGSSIAGSTSYRQKGWCFVPVSTSVWTCALTIFVAASTRSCSPAAQRAPRSPCPAVTSRASASRWITCPNRIDDVRATRLMTAAVTAAGKHVIIIGGGDTGADCLGTVHRQGAASVRQLELLPAPPATRAVDNPWPLWPNVFRTSSAHEEGGERQFSLATTAFSGANGRVRTLHGQRVERAVRDGRVSFDPVPDSEFELRADLVLLAMGFVGPVKNRLLDDSECASRNAAVCGVTIDG